MNNLEFDSKDGGQSIMKDDCPLLQILNYLDKPMFSSFSTLSFSFIVSIKLEKHIISINKMGKLYLACPSKTKVIIPKNKRLITGIDTT